jgi:putative DNA primase/helicase
MREQNLAPETCVLKQAHTQLLCEDDLLVAFRKRCLARVAAVRSGKMQKTDAADADPWLLNTHGGTRDLHSGECRAHQRADYITKITGAAPDASCPIPMWEGFLQRITDNNAELIDYLQRVSGYALTGSTEEHAIFFLYGTGNNGKSTFLSTLISAIGEYHRTAPIETFIASKHDQHPTDIASLRDARLVTATETEEGRRWAESRIKTLTGGDKVTARFMRQDFFEFTPVFKLIIAGITSRVSRRSMRRCGGDLI